jgi:hypothetical protein
MEIIMNDRPDARQLPSAAGLCATCSQARLTVSDRGSRFVRCERARTDPSFARYPPLPVLSCRGYDGGRVE